MAKLKRRERIDKIKEAIAALSRGELVSPISASNMYELTGVANELENLRVSLLQRTSSDTEKQEYVNQTISSVTHDLKTPLALIAGYAECLSDGMDDKDYVGLIRERALGMNDTVLKIIDSAKTELGESHKRMKFVKTKPYFERALKTPQESAKSKGIKMKIGRVPFAYISIVEREFDSVLLNILSNAIKYTDKGGKISVRFSRGSNKYKIIIKDSGCGIGEDDLPHIFEKYYTEDKARTHGGTGLGLYIAKETVEAHGGKILVKSKPGKGTTFTVLIPWYSVSKVDYLRSGGVATECNKWVSWCLCLFFGIFGAHKFYEKQYGLGILYIFTGGLFVFGWLSEIFIYLAHTNPYYIYPNKKKRIKRAKRTAQTSSPTNDSQSTASANTPDNLTADPTANPIASPLAQTLQTEAQPEPLTTIPTAEGLTTPLEPTPISGTEFQNDDD